MKRKLGIILLVALAVEAVNFPAGAGYALDPGSSSADAWYLQLLGLEWGALHAGGFFALDVLERGNSSPSPLGIAVQRSDSAHPVFMVPGSRPVPRENRLESLLHNHHEVKLPPWAELAVLLAGGYLSTVLMFLIVNSVFCSLRKWPASPRRLADQPR